MDSLLGKIAIVMQTQTSMTNAISRSSLGCRTTPPSNDSSLSPTFTPISRRPTTSCA